MTSWYGEAAGRKKGNAERRKKLVEEFRIIRGVNRLLRTVESLGRAAAGAVEVAAASVHAERVQGALKGVRKGTKG
jgi:hypothetical protein